MGKKSAAGLLGTLIAAGVAVGLAKYLKDYAGVSFTDEDQIKGVKNDSNEVKEAAKRTYIAIKEKGDVKEAAAELSKAAGAVVSDAAEIAKTAGSETATAIRDIKARYDEDPEAVKSEIAENISEMGQDIAKAAQTTAEGLKEKIMNAGSDIDVDEAFDDMEDDLGEAVSDAAEAAADAASDAADAAADVADSAADAAEDVLDAVTDHSEDAAEAVADAAADAAGDAVDAVADAADDLKATISEEQ